MKSKNDISSFKYHVPIDGKVIYYGQIEKAAKNLVNVYRSLCPDSKELWMAITRIEESVIWACSAITRND